MVRAQKQWLDPRGEDRVSTRILANLRWYGGERGVVIENLSSRGALLRSGALPDQGTDVVLHCGDMEIAATVSWVNPPTCGLSFHDAVDAVALRERAALDQSPSPGRREEDSDVQ